MNRGMMMTQTTRQPSRKVGVGLSYYRREENWQILWLKATLEGIIPALVHTYWMETHNV
jgi:hypothetical protein